MWLYLFSMAFLCMAFALSVAVSYRLGWTTGWTDGYGEARVDQALAELPAEPTYDATEVRF